MHKAHINSAVRGSRYAAMSLAALMMASSLSAQAQDAMALKQRYAALETRLADSPFGRALHLESSDTSGTLQGEVYAVVDQSYVVVGPALRGTDHWCEILILHLNVKGCQAAEGGENLSLSIGRKFDQPLADTYALAFRYQLMAQQPDYQRLELNADQGPMGTSGYRLMLEAGALDARRSLLRLSYAYRYGLSARLAMQGYLATMGRDKVGFSRVGTRADGAPAYIRGTRGVVERNTMRYYLAIEVYLGALATAASAREEQRLNDWHSAVERYPLQLHELDRDEYLTMKRRELSRHADIN